MEPSEYQALIKLSVYLLVAILAIVVVIRLMRRQLANAGRMGEPVDPEQMRLEMKALAAQKIAERKEKQTWKESEDSRNEETNGGSDNGNIEGQSLV